MGNEFIQCTKCKVFGHERYGVKEEPYCLKCWLVTYYGILPKEMAKIEEEIAKYRAKGVNEGTLRDLVISTLRLKARLKLNDMYERMEAAGWNEVLARMATGKKG
jgi:hypothetical protein